MARRLFGLVLAASALTGACKQGGPSEAEIEAKLEAIVAQRLASLVPPAPKVDGKKRSTKRASSSSLDEGGDAGTGESVEAQLDREDLYESTCLTAQANEHVKETAKLLVDLEALMDGYAPELPPSPEPPTKCMTKVSEANDPAGAKVEKLLQNDYKKRADNAKREREAILRRFADVDLPLAWSWVSAIVPGHEFELLRMRVDRCPGNNFDGTCDEPGGGYKVICAAGTDQTDCGGTTPLLVTEPTELMKRLAMQPDLKVEAKQHCVVKEAEVRDAKLLLTCRGPRRAEHSVFYVEVDQAAGESGGPLSTVGVGEVVSFEGHLVVSHKPHVSRAQPTWHFLKVPAEGTKIAAESTCCHGEAK